MSKRAVFLLTAAGVFMGLVFWQIFNLMLDWLWVGFVYGVW